MNTVLLFFGGGINVVAMLTMLCYQRKGATFKRHISILAYILLILTTLNAAHTFSEIRLHDDIRLHDIIWDFIVCVGIIFNRGNVSHLMPHWKHD